MSTCAFAVHYEESRARPLLHRPLEDISPKTIGFTVHTFFLLLCVRITSTMLPLQHMHQLMILHSFIHGVAHKKICSRSSREGGYRGSRSPNGDYYLLSQQGGNRRTSTQ